MNMANLAKRLNKLNGVKEPVKRVRSSMRQLRMDAWAEDEAREISEAKENPPGVCHSTVTGEVVYDPNDT